MVHTRQQKEFSNGTKKNESKRKNNSKLKAESPRLGVKLTPSLISVGTGSLRNIFSFLIHHYIFEACRDLSNARRTLGLPKFGSIPSSGPGRRASD